MTPQKYQKPWSIILIFKYNFLVYAETEHPRFGLIQGVLPTQNLNAGTELFTHYLYNEEQKDFPADFPWYYDWKKRIEGDENQNERLF